MTRVRNIWQVFIDPNDQCTREPKIWRKSGWQRFRWLCTPLLERPRSRYTSCQQQRTTGWRQRQFSRLEVAVVQQHLLHVVLCHSQREQDGCNACRPTHWFVVIPLVRQKEQSLHVVWNLNGTRAFSIFILGTTGTSTCIGDVAFFLRCRRSCGTLGSPVGVRDVRPSDGERHTTASVFAPQITHVRR